MLKYMCLIFILMLHDFAAADKLVHPEPDPDKWEQYYMYDFLKNNLSNNVTNEECTQLFNALNTEPYPKYSIRSLNSAKCTAFTTVKRSEMIQLKSSNIVSTQPVVCHCRFYSILNQVASETNWYIVTNNKEAYYRIFMSIHEELWNIVGYWIRVPDESNIKSKFAKSTETKYCSCKKNHTT